MQQNDMPRFAGLMLALAANFRQDCDEATLEAYRIGLGDLPIEDIERAVGRAIRQKTFMPPAAELRELAGVLKPADRALKAWEAFRRAHRIHGPYVSVAFDDPLITATIRNLGGWVQIDERLEVDDEKWIRKDFERVYASFAETGVAPSQCLPLAGICELENKRNGYEELDKPRLIETGMPPHTAEVVPCLTQDSNARMIQ